jgi:signal peptidase I
MAMENDGNEPAGGPAPEKDPADWYFDLPSGAWERQEQKNRDLRKQILSNLDGQRRDPLAPGGQRPLEKPRKLSPEEEREARRAALRAMQEERQDPSPAAWPPPPGGDDDAEWSTEPVPFPVERAEHRRAEDAQHTDQPHHDPDDAGARPLPLKRHFQALPPPPAPAAEEAPPSKWDAMFGAPAEGRNMLEGMRAWSAKATDGDDAGPSTAPLRDDHPAHAEPPVAPPAPLARHAATEPPPAAAAGPDAPRSRWDEAFGGRPEEGNVLEGMRNWATSRHDDAPRRRLLDDQRPAEAPERHTAAQAASDNTSELDGLFPGADAPLFDSPSGRPSHAPEIEPVHQKKGLFGKLFGKKKADPEPEAGPAAAATGDWLPDEDDWTAKSTLMLTQEEGAFEVVAPASNASNESAAPPEAMTDDAGEEEPLPEVLPRWSWLSRDSNAPAEATAPTGGAHPAAWEGWDGASADEAPAEAVLEPSQPGLSPLNTTAEPPGAEPLHAAEQPAWDTPAETAAAEEPAWAPAVAEQPAWDAPPATAAVEEPVWAPAVAEQPAWDAPAETPAVEEPFWPPAVAEQPAWDAPAETPAVEEPVWAPAVAEQPAWDTPTETAVVEEPAGAPAVAGQAGWDAHAEPAAVEPVWAPAVAEQPAWDAPAETVAIEEPVWAPTVAEQSAGDAPVEPAAVESVWAPTVAEQPAWDTPTETVAVEEPVWAPAVAEQPAWDAPSEPDTSLAARWSAWPAPGSQEDAGWDAVADSASPLTGWPPATPGEAATAAPGGTPAERAWDDDPWNGGEALEPEADPAVASNPGGSTDGRESDPWARFVAANEPPGSAAAVTTPEQQAPLEEDRWAMIASAGGIADVAQESVAPYLSRAHQGGHTRLDATSIEAEQVRREEETEKQRAEHREAPQAPVPQPQPYWVDDADPDEDDVVLRAFQAHANATEDHEPKPPAQPSAEAVAAERAAFQELFGTDAEDLVDEMTAPPEPEVTPFGRLQGWAPQRSADTWGTGLMPREKDWTPESARNDGQPPRGWGSDEDDAASEPELVGAGAGHRTRTWVRELVETGLLALLVFLSVRASFQNFKVDGNSMYPTLENGQFLIVNKLVYSEVDVAKLSTFVPFINSSDASMRYVFHGPERGDIVVLKDPRDAHQDLIKRVVGLPGETIEIKDGKIYINDYLLQEPYIKSEWRYTGPKMAIPAGEYFVMGDNRENSLDSRSGQIGLVPKDLIIGKAMLSYWPKDKFGLAPNEPGSVEGPHLTTQRIDTPTHAAEPGADAATLVQQPK